jgi:hypothetical protein
MTTFDETIRIVASQKEVWAQVQNATATQVIIAEHSPHSCIVRQEDNLYFIYQLTSTEDTTRLRLVITRDATAVKQLVHASNLAQALSELADEAISQVERDAAQAHLQHLKDLAEKPMLRVGTDKTKNAHSEFEGTPPFSRGSITLMTVVFGVITGGFLVALNWTRFGKNERVLPTIGLVLIGYPILFLTTQLMVTIIQAEILGSLLLFFVPNLVMVGIFDRWQTPYHRNWVAMHGKPRTGLTGCLTYIVIIVLGLMTWRAVVVPITTQIYTTIQPAFYGNGSVTINYTANWLPTNNYDEFCNQPYVQCLVTATDEVFGGDLLLARVHDVIGYTTTLQRLSDMVWGNTKPTLSDVVSEEPVAVVMDGRHGLRRDFTFTIRGQKGSGTFIMLQDGNDIVRLEIYYSPNLQNAVDDIIKSLHFTGG